MHEVASAGRTASETLLADLVGFPTVSKDSNLLLIDYVRDYLARVGVESELFHSPERTKASLFATVGPRVDGGVLLSGHTDVVPVQGQPWAVDPFRLTTIGTRHYGRGTADMKGFIACVLAAVPRFLDRPLRTPVHIALSYDEEIGCVGVRPMLRELTQRGLRPRACLVGEPTAMRPVLGHKGKLAMRCHVHGAPCHSAYAPDGVNAIEYAARLINRLTELGLQAAREGPRDTRFDPPFSTVQTGIVQGGSALNIVPGQCSFDFEVRTLPGADASGLVGALQAYAQNTIEPEMRAVNPDTGVRFEPLNAYPGLATPADHDAASLLAQLCGSSDFTTVAFGSEGGLFASAGLPAVVCGPGSMDQGHKPDEFVTSEQLAACDNMLARLADLL